MSDQYQTLVHHALDNFSDSLDAHAASLNPIRQARVQLYNALQPLYLEVAIPMATEEDVRGVAYLKNHLGWRGHPSYPHNANLFIHALQFADLVELAAEAGLNLWRPVNGPAPPTIAEEITVYEMLAHYIEGLGLLRETLNQERVALDAVAAAAARLCDRPIIPVSVQRDVQSVAILVAQSGWPGKIIYPTTPALLQGAQPLPALRAFAQGFGLQILSGNSRTHHSVYAS